MRYSRRLTGCRAEAILLVFVLLAGLFCFFNRAYPAKAKAELPSHVSAIRLSDVV